MPSHSTKLILSAAILTALSAVGCDSCSKGDAKSDASGASSSSRLMTPKMGDCMRALSVSTPHYTALAAFPAWGSEAEAKKGAELAKKGADASAAYKGTDDSVNKAFAAWADAIKALAPALDEMATALADAEKTTTEIAAKKKAGGLKKDEEQAMVTKMINGNATAQAKVNPLSAAQRKTYGDLADLCKVEQ